MFDLPSDDALEGPAREVVDLAEQVPDSVLVIAVSFAAYLLGSLSEDLFTTVLSSIPGARQISVEPVSLRRDLSGPAAVSAGGDSASQGEPNTPPPGNETTAAGSRAEQDMGHRPKPLDRETLAEDPAQEQLEQGAVQQEIARLGNSIERLESENALRLAILPPLATLACYLAIAQDWLWALSLSLIPAFLAQIRGRDGRISRETKTREQLIQTAKLTAARELAYGRLRGLNRLESERENQRLLGALELVAIELEENRDRIERYGDQVGDRLTLHDWGTNKSALAALAVRNENLWKELVHVYGSIYETIAGAGSPPDVELLGHLVRQLTDEQAAVRRKL